ncbi:MAG: helix-turn-helix domain-containing protein [Candidatus Omnitrophica bacterium]|nr:helix-turn-helix domain-containing protein [Candidatus Omnitrophota bacterium]
MQSVGEKLKNARKQKNVSLEEVYRQTKIHPNVLQALEEDRAHNFLSLIYIKSFLRGYAKYLQLDADKLLQEYSEGQNLKPAAVAEVVVEKKPKTPLRINKLLVLRIASVVGLSVILVFYFRVVLRQVSKDKRPYRTRETVLERGLPREITEEKIVVSAPLIKAENLILQVRAKENCWLKVDADEEVIFQKTLEKGKVEKWQAKEKLELRIGKPEALELQLNGELIDLEKEQVKKGLVITHEGIAGK